MGVARDIALAKVQQLSVVLQTARLLMSRRQFAQASALLGNAYREAFGVDRRFLQMMDPAQVPVVLQNEETVAGFISLLLEEAELLLQQGDAVSASSTASWAHRIAVEGRLPDTGELRGVLARLRALAGS